MEKEKVRKKKGKKGKLNRKDKMYIKEGAKNEEKKCVKSHYWCIVGEGDIFFGGARERRFRTPEKRTFPPGR